MKLAYICIRNVLTITGYFVRPIVHLKFPFSINFERTNKKNRTAENMTF